MSKTNMATHAELADLWKALLAALLARILKGRPSAEILFEARKLLTQSGYSGPIHTPKVHRQLGQLHASYLRALQAAIGSEKPSASVLHEARLFLLQTKAEREQSQGATPTAAIPSIPLKVPH